MSILPEDTQRVRVIIEDVLGYLPEGALHTSALGKKGQSLPPTALYRQAIWHLDQADVEYAAGNEREAHAMFGVACGLLQARGFMLPEAQSGFKTPKIVSADIIELHPNKN